jgi:DnaJ-class molecular chaperone
MNASFSAFSNNLDDVRDHWERVKLSYEILSEPRTRRRYDRHELLSDPGAALQRTALGAVGKGIKGMGKGIFGMAAFAVKSVAGDDKKEES